jgi:hypothetical protein
MKIIITEEQLDFIEKNKAYSENNSLEVFDKEVRKFLYCLISDDIKNISDYWSINGIKKGDLFRELEKYGIVTELEDHKLIVPKKNFDKKIKRVYYEFFEEEDPGLVIKEDEGGDGGMVCGGEIGDGATSASNSGSYETPLFGVQRRKIYKQ